MGEFDRWCDDFDYWFQRVKRGLLFTVGGVALCIILALLS